MVTFRPYRDGDAAGVAALLEDSAPPLYRAARVGDRLAALAIVIDEPGGGLMVISETVRRDEPNGVAVVAAVVADALRRLAAAGVRHVELDEHVTDPHLHPVTLTFPPGLPTDPLHVARLT
jgi:hypothetical protein